VELGDRPVLVGRADDADLVLDDPSTSRRHLEVFPEVEGYRVRDLESRSGTWIQERRVVEVELTPGDEVRVGDTVLRFDAQSAELPAPSSRTGRLGDLVGESEPMRRLFGLLETVAPLELSVLLQGETGTGKEGLARALHDLGRRRRAPYEVVDCTLLQGDHLRSELFGHQKGAFTGADADRIGAFERAHGGTLVLDEIGELPRELQPTLLRALEQGEVRPMGGDEIRRVRVRVVAATHRDLDGMVEAGTFRADLRYRISGVVIDVPPLRERGDDIQRLAEEFLPAGKVLSSAARDALRGHPWPGNVRELRNSLQRAAALAKGAEIGPADLGLSSAAPAPGELLARREVDAIREALRQTGGNKTRAAKLLGIARSTIYEKIRLYGLDEEGP
jgi:DNA-binding NtrC family response regulator